MAVPGALTRSCPWAELLAEPTMQGQRIDVFDGGGANAGAGSLPTTALSLAKINPVGRTISRSGKMFRINKRFQQENGMAILAPPISAQPLDQHTQQMTGQMRDPQRRQQ